MRFVRSVGVTLSRCGSRNLVLEQDIDHVPGLGRSSVMCASQLKDNDARSGYASHSILSFGTAKKDGVSSGRTCRGRTLESAITHEERMHHHHHACELNCIILGRCGQLLPELVALNGVSCLTKPLRRQAENVGERGPDA